MSSIFISYRSRDYDEGVHALYGHLIELFGEDNVMLDQSSFSPGFAWLPQMRSKVAMSDIVLCVMGSSWVAKYESPRDGEIDYVVEELTLARKLDKQVIPISLGADPIGIRNSLPSPIAWLADIQFFRFDPKVVDHVRVLANMIAALGGPRIRKTAFARQTFGNDGNFSVLRVFHVALGGIFKPTTYAASAMQSTLNSVQNSSLLAVVSMVLFALISILIVGDLNLFTVTKFTANLAVMALLAFVFISLLTKFVDSRPSTLSVASFSIHFSAAFHIAVVAWLLMFWIVLPDSVQQRFTSMATSELTILQQLDALLPDLTNATKWSLAAIQIGAFIHLVLIVFGVSRAGVIALGWKRWMPLLPLSVLALASLGFLFLLLSSSDGVRRGNLPQQVRLSWLADTVDSGGVKRQPFMFKVDGEIEKRNNSITLLVNQFHAENRTQPALEIRGLMCALQIWKGGQFVWPDVVHEGRAAIQHKLMPDQSIVRDNLSIEIPLGSQFRSGETAVLCYVEATAVSYPIGDGKWTVLRW